MPKHRNIILATRISTLHKFNLINQLLHLLAHNHFHLRSHENFCLKSLFAQLHLSPQITSHSHADTSTCHTRAPMRIFLISLLSELFLGVIAYIIAQLNVNFTRSQMLGVAYANDQARLTCVRGKSVKLVGFLNWVRGLLRNNFNYCS